MEWMIPEANYTITGLRLGNGGTRPVEMLDMVRVIYYD